MTNVGKGHVERLPSGSYRVRVYAGTDPLTGKEIRLKATAKTAERAQAELARERRVRRRRRRGIRVGAAAPAPGRP